MNYELAKQLKDAGFPQKDEEFSNFIDEQNKVCFHWELEGKQQEYYVPTLSELIEECGKRFNSLERFNSFWECKNIDKNNIIGEAVDGETPEDAVAKLWLSLNKDD